jgi:hypothetical protein
MPRGEAAVDSCRCTDTVSVYLAPLWQRRNRGYRAGDSWCIQTGSDHDEDDCGASLADRVSPPTMASILPFPARRCGRAAPAPPSIRTDREHCVQRRLAPPRPILRPRRTVPTARPPQTGDNSEFRWSIACVSWGASLGFVSAACGGIPSRINGRRPAHFANRCPVLNTAVTSSDGLSR